MEYIQIGTAGLRGPDGAVVQDIPLYVKGCDVEGKPIHNGLVDIVGILAEKYKEYLLEKEAGCES